MDTPDVAGNRDAGDAWQRVPWERCRWRVEAWHPCLKTGCRLEERHVPAVARLIRLLGLLTPIAVRLLQRRDVARVAPESAAVPVVEPAAVAIIAASVSLPKDASDRRSVLAGSRSAGWVFGTATRW